MVVVESWNHCHGWSAQQICLHVANRRNVKLTVGRLLVQQVGTSDDPKKWSRMKRNDVRGFPQGLVQC